MSPATRSEYEQTYEDAQYDVINLLLSALTEMAQWPEEARPWTGTAGDSGSRLRLQRSDIGNYLITKLEGEILQTKEGLAYEQIQYFSTTGLERQEHLRRINDYNQYLERLKESKKFIIRGQGTIWPLPSMMKAVLSRKKEGGNRVPLPSGQSAAMKDVISKLASSSPPPQLTDTEEQNESD